MGTWISSIHVLRFKDVALQMSLGQALKSTHEPSSTNQAADRVSSELRRMCVCRSSSHHPTHRWAISQLTTRWLERGRSQQGTKGCSVSLNSFDGERPRIPLSLTRLAECGNGRAARFLRGPGTEAESESVNGDIERGCPGDGTCVYLGHPT